MLQKIKICTWQRRRTGKDADVRYESEEKKNLIFDLMNGSLVLDEVKDLCKDQIVDEFAQGSYCSELYEEVYQAKVSLCNRLGVQEDSDIETIISNLLLIGKHLSMKMFDYGMEEERKQEKKHN